MLFENSAIFVSLVLKELKVFLRIVVLPQCTNANRYLSCIVNILQLCAKRYLCSVNVHNFIICKTVLKYIVYFEFLFCDTLHM